jgi:hypothetical protein
MPIPKHSNTTLPKGISTSAPPNVKHFIVSPLLTVVKRVEFLQSGWFDTRRRGVPLLEHVGSDAISTDARPSWAMSRHSPRIRGVEVLLRGEVQLLLWYR